MCQLWALHVVAKRQFFTLIFAVFLLNLFLRMYIIAQAYLRCCGVAKTNGSYLRFKFGNRRHCHVIR